MKICYHKENLCASFSFKKRLILAPWLWFHGNLRHCNCLLPQSHSLLCAGSGSPSDPLSHFNKLSQQKKKITFSDWFSFFCLCALKWQREAFKGARTCSWDKEEGQDHSILQSGLFCQGTCSLCVRFLPPQITSWAPPLSCNAVKYHQVGWSTLVYKERYSSFYYSWIAFIILQHKTISITCRDTKTVLWWASTRRNPPPIRGLQWFLLYLWTCLRKHKQYCKTRWWQLTDLIVKFGMVMALRNIKAFVFCSLEGFLYPVKRKIKKA